MFGLAIHGGAGTLPRSETDGESESKYRAGLAAALDAGYALLQAGGSSLDAVTRAVMALEDNPLFNAGFGSVFTLDGHNELDAAIMDGGTLKAGAVCGVTHIRNPIDLARAVMEQSEHVMLSGAGAEEFALSQRLRAGAAELFLHRRNDGGSSSASAAGTLGLSALTISHVGTVGAVALDAHGRLAAAHIHRRHDRQALPAHRRFAHHRCRHLCGRPLLRSVGHRAWRDIHPRRGGP